MEYETQIMHAFIPILIEISKHWVLDYRDIKRRFMSLYRGDHVDIQKIMQEVMRRSRRRGGQPYLFSDFWDTQKKYSVIFARFSLKTKWMQHLWNSSAFQYSKIARRRIYCIIKFHFTGLFFFIETHSWRRFQHKIGTFLPDSKWSVLYWITRAVWTTFAIFRQPRSVCINSYPAVSS